MKNFANFMITCMIVSIIGTIIMIIETWFPLGDIMEDYLGLFGKAIGFLLAVATFIGWGGWVFVITVLIEEKRDSRLSK